MDATATIQNPKSKTQNDAASAPAKLALVWTARIVVAALFVLAAWGKLSDPIKFAEQIRDYQLVPVLWSNAIAFLLPPLELVTAVLLVGGFWRFEARLIIVGMLVVFTIAKISVEVRGLSINCGCFGGVMAGFQKTINGPWGIVFNIALLALLAVDWAGSRRREYRVASSELGHCRAPNPERERVG